MDDDSCFKIDKKKHILFATDRPLGLPILILCVEKILKSKLNTHEKKKNIMTNEEAIKYLKQLYPHGGCCWLDEQRIDAISIAINAIEKVSKLGHSEVTKISDQEISMEIDHLFKENGWSCLEEVDVDLVARHFVNWQNEQVRIRAYCWLKNQPRFCVTDDFIKEFCDYITDVETKKGGDDVQKR